LRFRRGEVLGEALEDEDGDEDGELGTELGVRVTTAMGSLRVFMIWAVTCWTARFSGGELHRPPR